MWSPSHGLVPSTVRGVVTISRASALHCQGLVTISWASALHCQGLVHLVGRNLIVHGCGLDLGVDWIWVWTGFEIHCSHIPLHCTPGCIFVGTIVILFLLCRCKVGFFFGWLILPRWLVMGYLHALIVLLCVYMHIERDYIMVVTQYEM